MSEQSTHQATYILPFKANAADGLRDLAGYLNGLRVAQVIVADGSPPPVFARLHSLLDSHIEHVAPDPHIRGCNGKVRNVVTALRLARNEAIVVADDDVRYDDPSLARVLALLRDADVVRPQNYFEPLPWHALLDTGRTLLNRALDGDWPGTLAFRRSMLPRGYNADVLFENFELVRTIRARGGREIVARDAYVRRLPPTTAHFWSQRVRQAYDEFARPARLAAALAILPALAISAATRAWIVPEALGALALAFAAFGWMRDGGTRHFPALAILAAPVWVLERAVCAWFAVYERARYGGVRYAGGIVRDAASPREELRRWAV